MRRREHCQLAAAVLGQAVGEVRMHGPTIAQGAVFHHWQDRQTSIKSCH
jgi:hypothetical protein